MTPEQWRQVEQVLQSAMDVRDSERSAYLDEACAGRPSIRAEVESLLAAQEGAGDFIDAAIASEVSHDVASEEALLQIGSYKRRMAQAGRYDIVSELGRGGMGMVYLAQDTRLKRLVAIKSVLPSRGHEQQEWQDMVRRLIREAQASGSLHHPNIVGVHDVIEDGDFTSIVMEFVKGKTLAETVLLGSPALPAFAIGVLRQCADALDYAHSQGIVHRDIKPLNIMLDGAGLAKITDFGVAKVLHSATDLTHGLAIGTLEYMAPEQLEGRPVEGATDQYSLAVVAYRMLTGHRIFEAETMGHWCTLILRENPLPASQWNPSLSRAADAVLSRAMAKNAAMRYSSCRQFVMELEQALTAPTPYATLDKIAEAPVQPAPQLEHIIQKALENDRNLRHQIAPDLNADLQRFNRDSSSDRVSSGLTAEHAIPAARRRPSMAIPVIATVGLVSFALLSWIAVRPKRLSVDLKPKRLTANPSDLPVTSTSMSRDGKYLAYSDRAGIHLHILQSGESRLLPETAGMYVTQWSPDSTSIGAARPEANAPRTYWNISILGGAPRQSAITGTPSPDGSQVAFARPNFEGTREIWVQSASEENPRKLPASDRFNVPTSSLFWSPDGSRLAWINYHWQVSSSRRGDYSIRTFELKTGATRTLLPASPNILSALVGLADGRVIYSQCDGPQGRNSCNLWELRASRSGDPIGEPVRLTHWADFSIVGLDATADGKQFTFLRFVYQTDVYLGRLEANNIRMQTPRRITLDERNDSPTGWTSDSKAVLFQSDRTGTMKIYKQDIDEDLAEAIVPGPDRQGGPRLTPDGASVLYLSGKADQQGLTSFTRLMGVPISGGQPHQVLSPSEKLVGYRCSEVSSGPCILVEREADQGSTIYLLDPTKGKGREIYHTERGAGGPAISPDGRHLAFVLPGQPGNRIRILSIDGAVEREVLATDPANLISLDWSSDGRGFFCGKLIPEKGSALLFIDLTGKTDELWRQPGTGTVNIWGVPSPDGKYVAILGGTFDSNVWVLERD